MSNAGNRLRFPTRIIHLVAGAAVLCALPLQAAQSDYKPTQQPNKEMSQAVTLLGQGKLNEADALFQKALDRDPKQLDAALGRAQIAMSEHELDKADQMVTAVLKLHDNLPEAHNMKGVVLLLRKDRAGAGIEFKRALELQPKYVTPRIYLAAMARTNGDFAGAADQYKELIQTAPRLPTGYLGEAEALTMLHREPDAIKVLESWKTADSASLLPYQVLANIYISDQKPQDAIRQLQAALAKSPHDSATLTTLGDAYAAAGNGGAAATQYDAALASNHANITAALRLGELEAGVGQTDRALVHFRMALKTDPNNPLAANDVAWLLAARGKNLDEAQRLAELAVKQSPQYADAYDTLGYVQYRRGQYPAAVATLKKAETLAPKSMDVAAHLGLAYAKTGHKQEALTELRRALGPGSAVSNRPELEHVVADLSANPSTSSIKAP
jgi:tetratricopeptide (TPR) repeat protein